MRTETGSTVFRSDYQPYPLAIDRVELCFDLDGAATEVDATLHFRRVHGTPTDPVWLDGEALELLGLWVDGSPWPEALIERADGGLRLHGLPSSGRLRTQSRCHPDRNTTLMGLYQSGQSLYTQCEAEGFRRITWFPDRPDVMSRYRVVLRGDPARYPVMLSNGNPLNESQLPDGRREVVWDDPFPKPCYLFALVAGHFDCRERTLQTRSGRDVLLQVYCDPGQFDQTAYAMDSLERALRWDEERYGLELDLDRYMIVATRDFNMGAMENKGLNVFNAAYVLADPDLATDDNYAAIEAVVGHEYFHNWTGNRVTCRDWFQLSLKEGLTVFRDQEFSADMMAAGLDEQAAASARAVKRIDDVMTLRAAQFPEDAGPMAHPIRPESYEEIGNFYTATVYEKGAEVIRMIQTLLGREGFAAGLAEYFRRHDGQAVTCDDFVDAMEWAALKRNGRDLSLLRRWYQQAGTPRVRVQVNHDANLRQCTITLEQHCDPVGVELRNGKAKQPFHIPFAIGLLDRHGKALPLEPALDSQDIQVDGDTALLELRDTRASWTFVGIDEAPVPSLLRDFSAPVVVESPLGDDDLALLLSHDSNAFARWEAGQELMSRAMLARISHPERPYIDKLLNALASALRTPGLDPAYRALLLSLPAEKVLAERLSKVMPLAVQDARDDLRRSFARHALSDWQHTHDANATPGPYSPDAQSAGKRALRNLALHMLVAAGGHEELAHQRYTRADNMTDRLAALTALVHLAPEAADRCLADFEQRHREHPLAIDKWFMVQATAPSTTADRARELMRHSAFTLRNPNRARSLVFQFCLNNSRGFHAPDGSGYAFWAENVRELDALNPEVAARLARAMDRWSRIAEPQRHLMRQAVADLIDVGGLSRNTHEILHKSLELGS